MGQDQIERRLAAILMADVVGFSRMMGKDETATLHALQEHRFAVINPTIGQHHGRIVKLMGDGIMVEFQSVHDAVNCAVSIQCATVPRNIGVPEDRQIRLRISVNLGDILIENDDIYGDGINIAARMQEIAEPNGVCISSSVFEQIGGETGYAFADMGAHLFKNITKAIRVYHHSPDITAKPAKAAFRHLIDIPFEESVTTGGCLCGEVRYEVAEKALGSMICHCRMCQRFSGAPLLGATTFKAESLHFTKGSPKFYQSSKIAERGFCGDCGSALVYRGLVGNIWTKWIVVFTASLDEPEKFPPTYHLGIESSMPWLDIHDDLPRTECKDSPSLIDAYNIVGQEVP